MSDNATRAAHLNSITERIIGCAFTVGGTLGPGYLEKVYENALAHELRKAGLAVEQQRRMSVWYDGVIVGEYVTDLVVEDAVLVEIKATKALVAANEAQCINCLTTTRLPLGLLLNFGARVDVRRLVGPAAPMFPANHPFGCQPVASLACGRSDPSAAEVESGGACVQVGNERT